MNRSASLSFCVLACTVALSLPKVTAAPVTFDFETVAAGTTTTFSDTKGGINATFSDPNASLSYLVADSFLNTLTGHILYDANGVSVPLDITFDTILQSISLNFATNGAGQFTMDLFLGGMLVGNTSATGSIPPGVNFPEGTVAFSSPGIVFDSVRLSSTAADFAVDNITVEAAPTSAVPEPASITLMGLGSIGMFGGWYRKRRKTLAMAA